MQFHQRNHQFNSLNSRWAFVLALVAASQPGADMLKKAATWIEKAIKCGLRANIELDEENNEDVSEIREVEDDEIVVADSICKPKNMLEMLELLLAFHAWYKKDIHFL